jgi:hypothetical protein
MSNTNTPSVPPSYGVLGYTDLGQCRSSCFRTHLDVANNNDFMNNYNIHACNANCEEPTNSSMKRCHGFIDGNNKRNKPLCDYYCTKNVGTDGFNQDLCKASCNINC